jgi:hypothetical protein
VAGYRRRGEEEVAPVEGGEKRRPSDIRSRAEEVAGGARWHAARPAERRR